MHVGYKLGVINCCVSFPNGLWFSRDAIMIPEMSDRVEMNPRVCGGQPVIKGTRISVAVILEQLAAEASWDSILRGYPELSRTDIQAALDYARRSLLHTEITTVGAA